MQRSAHVSFTNLLVACIAVDRSASGTVHDTLPAVLQSKVSYFPHKTRASIADAASIIQSVIAGRDDPSCPTRLGKETPA